VSIYKLNKPVHIVKTFYLLVLIKGVVCRIIFTGYHSGTAITEKNNRFFRRAAD